MQDTPQTFSEDDLLAYVQGRAEADLTQRIEGAAGDDPGLAAELALMIGLKPALAPENGMNSPGEFGWRRLEAAIDSDLAGAATSPPRATPQTPIFWRVAAALLAVVVLGEAAYISTRLGPDPGYVTATETSGVDLLAISFAPDAPAQDIAALLRDAGGQIVEGPSAIGLFRVSFKDAETAQAARALFETSPLIDLIAEE